MTTAESSVPHTLRATIVVPVYNASHHIESCAPSLLGQSIGPDHYEVVYVDDGSTDDSAERLDRLAAAHPHVRVIHQENSGWPGKPRNVGIAHSRGEFVQFVDQDDELGEEALERLCALGAKNESDIVLGKVVGTMQPPSSVFARTIDRCSVRDHSLMDSLTPHKMFRRSFLLEHGIRFPEGRCRLEDQLFMARAYVATDRVSVLADYPCYYWMRRADEGNNSSAPIDVRGYFGNLRQVVRALKDGTEPGAERDALLRRTYRVEILQQVSEPRVLSNHLDVRSRFEAVRELVAEEFAPGVREGLPAVQRLRATLLEEGRLDGLRALAERTRTLRAQARLGRLRWRDGRLTAPLRMTLTHDDGTPVVMVERDGRLLLDPRLLEGNPAITEWEVGDPLRAASAHVLLKDRKRPMGWFPACDLRAAVVAAGPGRSRLEVRGDLVVDPLTAAGGAPLQRGVYDVRGSVQLLGVGRSVRITGDRRGELTAAGAARVGPGAVGVVPYWTAERTLAVDVGEFYHRMDALPPRRWTARIPAPARRPLGRAWRTLRAKAPRR
ncbi:glycosyltransferase family A protein [Streptomyces sp. NRRL WC-3549]|uniref:glycosyltransferase family A protein n=1 Tax=Streptomyces sp. NRRL WC-3549 TaxID=1463925 RepID=UPI00068DEBAE|nr:glycosyltransferase family A protein [Streptomyces sp. NRRL WC-3549]